MEYITSDLTVVTPYEIVTLPKFGPYMVTQQIGCNRVGDKFVMFDMAANVYVTLAVSCSTPERLLAHFKGFVANRLEVAK